MYKLSGRLGKRTAVDLILEEDEGERGRLEEALQVSRKDMVDYFIEEFANTANPIWINLSRGSAEERLEAVRAYLRRVKDIESAS